MEVQTMLSEKGKRLLVVCGFKFCVGKILKDNTLYWRCVNKKTKCPAKLYTPTTNFECVLKYNLNHNHEPEENLERQKLSNCMKRKAASDPYERPSKIIHSELRQCGASVENITTNDLNLIRKNIYECRKSQVSTLPRNQDEVFCSLKNLSPKTSKDESFLMVNSEEHKIVIFSCRTNLHFLCSVETIFMDGTFNYCAKFFCQFFTLHGYKNGHYVPLVFCLLPSKKQLLYQNLFNLLTEKCAENHLILSPKNVVIDFEVAIHNAVTFTWPESTIVGCRFHLSQAWFRKLQALGLSTEYKNNTEIGKKLKYFFGLQFLEPNEVGDCFTFDLVSDLPEDERLKQFCDYLVDTYIDECSQFPPNIWANLSSSLYRTTNACESFHSKFNNSFYHSHPSIFKFVDILLNFQTETYIKIVTANKFPKALKADIRKKKQFVETKIREYMSNEIDRTTFIKCVSCKYAPS